MKEVERGFSIVGFERYKKTRIWERYVLVVSVRGFEDLR